MIFLMLIGLFTTRVILDSLGAEDYGIYNIVGGFVSMFSVFRAGLTSATQRFITFDLGKGNKENLRRTFSTCVIIHLILAALIIVIGEIGGLWFLENKLTIPAERLNAAQWTFQLSLLALVIGFVSTPYNALIISHERMKAFAYISIYEGIAKLIVAYQLYFTTYDRLITYSILLCLIQISVRMAYSIYCHRYFEESKLFFHFDWAKIKEIYSFTGWAMFGGLAHIGFTQGLNVLLNMFFNPVINAARGVAVQVEHVINNFVINFQQAVNPQIIKSYSRDEKEAMFKLIFASSKFSFFLIFFFTLPAAIEAEQILGLWLKEVPPYTCAFFRLMMIPAIIDAISNPIMRAVDASGRIRNYQLIVGGILLMIVPVSYLVLSMGAEPYSVFIVHIVLGLIAFIARLWMAQILVGISLNLYYKYVLKKIALVAITSSALPLTVYSFFPATVLRLFCIVTTSSLSIASMIYAFGLTHSEKEMIQKRIFAR